MKKVFLLLLVLLVIPLSVNALSLGFESGNLDGWIEYYPESNTGVEANNTISVISHSGNYALSQLLNSEVPAGGGESVLYREDIPNNFTSISFYYKINHENLTGEFGYRDWYVFVADSFTSDYYDYLVDIYDGGEPSPEENGWVYVEYNNTRSWYPPEYSGDVGLYIENHGDSGSELEVLIDDIVIIYPGEPTPTPTPTPSPTLTPYNPCQNQTGNITIDLAAATTNSLIWYWDESVNLTKVALDGKVKNSFDLDESSYTATGLQPSTWHRLKIYNDTDFGMLNCTTNPENRAVSIPIMPSTENDGWFKSGNWWILAVGLIGIVAVFKKW